MEQVCIYEEADYINTLSVKELLESSDILTYMPNENMGSIFSPGVFGAGTFKIFVPEDQVDQALEILKGHLFIEDEDEENETQENDQTIERFNPQGMDRQTIYNKQETVILNGEQVSKPVCCPKCGSENISTSHFARGVLVTLSLLFIAGGLVPKNPKKKCKTCHHTWV